MFARPLIVAALLLGVIATAANAQARRVSVIPAETPPASFSGSQYVDSRGCVFVRAGSNGQVSWVPRFGADRQPVCGFPPSGGDVPAPQADGMRPGTVPAPEVIATAPRTDTPRRITPNDVRIPETSGGIIDAAPLAPATTATPVPAATPRAPSPQRTPTRTVARTQAPASAPTPAPAATAAPASAPPQGDGEWVMWDGSSPAPIGGNRVWVPRVPGTPAPAAAPAPAAPRASRPAHTAVAVPRTPPPSGISPFAVPAADPWGWSARPTPRLNGEPQATATTPVTPPAGAGRAAGGHFVQVGAFAVPSNAERTQARLRDRGLPVAVSRQRSGGRDLALIMAGPFASPADLHAALTAARRMGFRDAYIR